MHKMPSMSGFLWKTAKTYSDLGMNTIIDTVTDDNLFLDKAVELLHEYPVLFVHVTCPLEELRRREKERSDRLIGLAEEQLSLLCPLDNTYEECADKVMELLYCSGNFSAFRTLWRGV